MEILQYPRGDTVVSSRGYYENVGAKNENNGCKNANERENKRFLRFLRKISKGKIRKKHPQGLYVGAADALLCDIFAFWQ